ncbi:cytochrome b-245 light chain-like [Styela clava]|uniref:cytochrome b-245 light chain-like n=1 Tax=Styela clava TaxID=7725 RepID=UPI00193A95AA|nr:cytochrome b-245 light chain-like [Styela clava]
MAPRPQEKQRSIQWSMWANETALMGAWIVVLGGIVGIIGGAVEEFQYWLPFGIYSLVFGLLVVMLEYPRGKKNKGNTVTRSHQEIFTKINHKMYKFTRSYYIRALVLFLVCLPAGVIVPTFFGAFCLLSASIIYLVAAIRNEEWTPVGIQLDRAQRIDTISSPPSKPPPRLPQQI